MRSTYNQSLKLVLGSFFALITALGISGCDFVDPGSDLDKLKPLDQAHLPIYKANQYIEYDIIVSGTNAVNAEGTLRIEWSIAQNPVDSNPLDGGGVTPIENILKETITLEYSGEPVTIVRYITQDQDVNSATYGAISLHAFNSFSDSTKFSYVHSSSSAGEADFPTQTMIFPSPLLDDTSYNLLPNQLDFDINYYVLPNCGVVSSSTCDPANQQYEETMQLTNAKVTTVESLIGFFETIQIPYGQINDGDLGRVRDLDLSDLEKLRLDTKATCGNLPELLITFYGDLYVYPKIGIIRYENFCVSDSGTVWFNGTVSRTNIPF